MDSLSLSFMSASEVSKASAPSSGIPSFSRAFARASCMRVRQSSDASSIRACRSSGGRSFLVFGTGVAADGLSSSTAATALVAGAAAAGAGDGASADAFSRRGRFAASGTLMNCAMGSNPFRLEARSSALALSGLSLYARSSSEGPHAPISPPTTAASGSNVIEVFIGNIIPYFCRGVLV